MVRYTADVAQTQLAQGLHDGPIPVLRRPQTRSWPSSSFEHRPRDPAPAPVPPSRLELLRTRIFDKVVAEQQSWAVAAGLSVEDEAATSDRIYQALRAPNAELMTFLESCVDDPDGVAQLIDQVNGGPRYIPSTARAAAASVGCECPAWPSAVGADDYVYQPAEAMVYPVSCDAFMLFSSAS